jgi:hypothetical protein
VVLPNRFRKCYWSCARYRKQGVAIPRRLKPVVGRPGRLSKEPKDCQPAEPIVDLRNPRSPRRRPAPHHGPLSDNGKFVSRPRIAGQLVRRSLHGSITRQHVTGLAGMACPWRHGPPHTSSMLKGLPRALGHARGQVVAGHMSSQAVISMTLQPQTSRKRSDNGQCIVASHCQEGSDVALSLGTVAFAKGYGKRRRMRMSTYLDKLIESLKHCLSESMPDCSGFLSTRGQRKGAKLVRSNGWSSVLRSSNT